MNVVVTGSSTGIGRALVAAFTARGGTVMHCSRSGGGGGLPCDVRDESAVTDFASAVLREMGPPDVLINNAGIARWGAVAAMATEDWNDVFATNVTGMFLMTRAFLPDMLRRASGTIVNIASLAGRNGIANGAAYSASKHAVLGFSRSLMLEVRAQGVRVIAICPGSVDTPIFEKETPPFATSPERMMRPEDVAQAVADAVLLPPRATVSELDIRPAQP